MARVKGSNILKVVKALRARREEALTRIPPRHRHYLDDRILASSWYPETDQLDLLAVLTTLLPPGGDPWVMAGRLAAENDLAGIYAHLLHRGDVGRSLQNAGVLWRNSHDTGKVETSVAVPGAAEISLRGYAIQSAEMCRLVGGYAEGIATLAGAREARARHLECRLHGDARCLWRVTWT